jgi:hypothetical protein
MRKGEDEMGKIRHCSDCKKLDKNKTCRLTMREYLGRCPKLVNNVKTNVTSIPVTEFDREGNLVGNHIAQIMGRKNKFATLMLPSGRYFEAAWETVTRAYETNTSVST